MSNIEFEADFENNPHYARRTADSNTVVSGGVPIMQGQEPSRVGMISWLIRHGIINKESSARGFLIALIALNFIATGLILYFFVLR